MNFKLSAVVCIVAMLLSAPASADRRQDIARAKTECAESSVLQRDGLRGYWGARIFTEAFERCMLGRGFKRVR